MMMQQQQKIHVPFAVQIANRELWKVAPEELIGEIDKPGSSSLPEILPCVDSELNVFSVPKTEEITVVDDLGNIHLKICPELRTQFYGEVVNDSRSYGQRRIDDVLSGNNALRYSDFAGRSLLFIRASMSDYFSEVDAAVSECNRGSETIASITNLVQKREKGEAYNSLLLPIGKEVYYFLRKKGYSYRDITA